MKSNKNQLVFLMVLALGLMFFQCTKKSVDLDDNVDNTDFAAIEIFSFRGEVENQTQLSVEVIFGDLVTTGSPETDSVIILAEKYVGSESVQDAQAHLSELQVSITVSEDEFLVRTIFPDETGGRHYRVNYEIICPLHFTVKEIRQSGNE